MSRRAPRRSRAERPERAPGADIRGIEVRATDVGVVAPCQPRGIPGSISISTTGCWKAPRMSAIDLSSTAASTSFWKSGLAEPDRHRPGAVSRGQPPKSEPPAEACPAPATPWSGRAGSTRGRTCLTVASSESRLRSASLEVARLVLGDAQPPERLGGPGVRPESRFGRQLCVRVVVKPPERLGGEQQSLQLAPRATRHRVAVGDEERLEGCLWHRASPRAVR